MPTKYSSKGNLNNSLQVVRHNCVSLLIVIFDFQKLRQTAKIMQFRMGVQLHICSSPMKIAWPYESLSIQEIHGEQI